MPKYWGKQIFALGRFPAVGQKQKTEERERKKMIFVMAAWAIPSSWSILINCNVFMLPNVITWISDPHTNLIKTERV